MLVMTVSKCEDERTAGGGLHRFVWSCGVAGGFVEQGGVVSQATEVERDQFCET